MPISRPQLGWFHLTVAAAMRGREVFASLRDGRFVPSLLGRIAERQWRALCARNAPALVCHAFQIMPDHVHVLVHVSQPPARPLGALVGAWKAATTTCARREIGFVSNAPLWEEGFHVERKQTPQEVATARLYVEDNPSAAKAKRAAKARWGNSRPLTHFRLPRFWPGAGPGETPPAWSGFGDSSILDSERMEPVSVSRHASEDELRALEAHMCALAKTGIVLVTPAISPGEKRALDVALRAGGRAIHLESRPVDCWYKPGPDRLAACSAGRLLEISPFATRVPLSRALCEELNALSRAIAETR